MSEGLAQGPYVAARGEVEPTTFRIEATNTTPQPTMPLIINKLN